MKSSGHRSRYFAYLRNWRAHGRIIHVLGFCAALMIVATFTRPGRSQASTAGQADWIAMSKLAARGLAAAVGGTVLCAAMMRRTEGRRCRELVPIGMFAAWGLASSSWSAKPTLSLTQAGCFACLCLFAAALAMSVRTRRDQSTILAYVSGGTIVVCLVLLFSNVLAYGSLKRSIAGTGAEGLLHPTTAASTAALGILILVTARLAARWRWARWFFVPGMAVLVLTLVLAWSRLATAMTAVVAVGLIALLAPRPVLAICCAIGGAAGAAYFLADPGGLLIEDVVQRMWSYAARGQSMRELSAASGRGELWPIMFRSFFDSPWIGHGYYVTTSAGEFTVWHDRGNYSAHNILLQVAVTTGVVGLMLFLWGLARPLATFARVVIHEQRLGPLPLLVIACGTWYVGWGTLNVSFTAPFQPEAVILFTVLGLMTAHIAVHSRRARAIMRQRRRGL